MTLTVDYLPIANGAGANVESQAQYVIDLAPSGDLEDGYEAGLAKSIQVNKTLRQASMVAAAVANFIAQQLQTDVLDDGNLTLLISNLTDAIAVSVEEGIVTNGQCYLSVSGGNLLLSPKDGNKLIIDGVAYSVPAAGVTLAPTALTPGSAYYIYAKQTAGVISLEASATAYVIDTTSGNIGVAIKNGDPTRSLVGQWLVATGPTWSTVAVQGLSWFNRKTKSAQTNFIGSPATGSPAFVELSTSIRNSFLVWSGEEVRFDASGSVAVSGVSSGSFVTTSVGFDGTTNEKASSIYENYAADTVGTIGFGGSKPGLSEALHYLTMLGLISSGTGTWAGGTGTSSCQLQVSING